MSAIDHVHFLVNHLLGRHVLGKRFTIESLLPKFVHRIEFRTIQLVGKSDVWQLVRQNAPIVMLDAVITVLQWAKEVGLPSNFYENIWMNIFRLLGVQMMFQKYKFLVSRNDILFDKFAILQHVKYEGGKVLGRERPVQPNRRL